MKERWRHISWWRWALVLVAAGAVVYVGVEENLVAAILAVAAIAAAVFAVWNPFEARPKPTLALQPLGHGEVTSLEVGAALRPVDVDAVVEDARTIASGSTPLSSAFKLGFFAQPTKEDYEKYEADVEVYAEQVRVWAHEADEWIRERATVLAANTIQRNPTSVDAEEAGVSVLFPAGTEEYENAGEPPELPERPGFPLRKSTFALLGSPNPLSGQWTRPSITPHLRYPLTQPELVRPLGGALRYRVLVRVVAVVPYRGDCSIRRSRRRSLDPASCWSSAARAC